VGVVFAFLNAALFALYIVLAHRVARSGMGGIDRLAAAMLAAWVFVMPVGVLDAAPAFVDPVAVAAGIGVGISSSVIPYVFDQLAMARMRRATYALLVSLLPATATVIGVVVLGQVPSIVEVVGVALVVAAVAVHREPTELDSGHVASPGDHVPRAAAVPAGRGSGDEAGPAWDGRDGRSQGLSDRAREGAAG
jgi:inner membrane transporter RhtA